MMRGWLAALFLCAPALAHAALTMPTRVIYAADQGEAVIRVQYPGDGTPLLMQAWLDEGGESVLPQDQNPPFVLNPPVARIQPGQTQTLRFLQTRDELPPDRESLFYLNVLEIPPGPEKSMDAEKNFIQVATHTRVKFFYRPKGLGADPAQAPQQLRFTLETPAVVHSEGQVRVQVRVRNPSPYHVTLRDVSLHPGDVPASDSTLGLPALAGRDPDERAPVIAPLGEQVISLLLAAARLPALMHVRLGAINDYGAVQTLHSPLHSPQDAQH